MITVSPKVTTTAWCYKSATGPHAQPVASGNSPTQPRAQRRRRARRLPHRLRRLRRPAGLCAGKHSPRMAGRPPPGGRWRTAPHWCRSWCGRAAGRGASGATPSFGFGDTRTCFWGPRQSYSLYKNRYKTQITFLGPGSRVQARRQRARLDGPLPGCDAGLGPAARPPRDARWQSTGRASGARHPRRRQDRSLDVRAGGPTDPHTVPAAAKSRFNISYAPVLHDSPRGRTGEYENDSPPVCSDSKSRRTSH